MGWPWPERGLAVGKGEAIEVEVQPEQWMELFVPVAMDLEELLFLLVELVGLLRGCLDVLRLSTHRVPLSLGWPPRNAIV